MKNHSHPLNEAAQVIREDVAEHRSALSLLQQYKNAIDIALIVSKTDPKGIITYVNDRFCEVSGYTAKELVGKPHNIIRHPDTSASLFKTMWDTLLKKETWNGVIKNRTKSGGDYYVKSTIIPILDINGEIIEFMALREDVTELETARQRAESAETAKAQFLANMSHEIRTPMNGVIGFTHILGKTRLDDDQRRYVEIIENSAQTLLGIVDDILDFSKIESGKMELEYIAVNPFPEFDKAFCIFETKMREKHIDYTIRIDPSLGECLFIDVLRLKQVMSNLIGNALKFTPEFGRISVEIRSLAKEGNGHWLEFSVEDNGIGISKARQEHIFEEFTQADVSMTRKFGGTGLGLSISASLVAMMGGRLRVESEEGRGSRFYFKIHVNECGIAQPVVDEKTDRKPETAYMYGELKVLVAEDYDVNRMLVDELLKSRGIAADFAQDGKEAVQKSLKKRYDLILMDINMPVMNGIEATQLIRRRDDQIPIIALTANVLESDRELFLAAGMNATLIKPLDPDAIEAVLKACGGKKEQADNGPAGTEHDIAVSVKEVQKALKLPDDIVHKLLEKFVKSSRESLHNIAEASAGPDFHRIRVNAHNLKGSAGTLKLFTLAERAGKIEMNADAKRLVDYRAAVRELEDEITRISRFITAR